MDIQLQYTLEGLSDYIRDSALLKIFKEYFASFVKDIDNNIYLEFGHWATIFQNRTYDPPVIVIVISSENQTDTEFTPLDLIPQPSSIVEKYFGSGFMDLANLPDKIFIGSKVADIDILYWGLDIVPTSPKSTLRFKEYFYSLFPPTLPTVFQVETIKLLDLETNEIKDISTNGMSMFLISERLGDSLGLFKPLFYRNTEMTQYPFVRTKLHVRYQYLKGTFHLNIGDTSSFEIQSQITPRQYLEKIFVDIVLKKR